MMVPSRVDQSPGAYEEALFAKWLLARRAKLSQPIDEGQKTSNAEPNPSETGSTS
jgi:hypothetical protein